LNTPHTTSQAQILEKGPAAAATAATADDDDDEMMMTMSFY